MNKAVLISIQPKWCELIASGKKTVEVRKSKPKLETPFKVYIYCTKGKFSDLGVIGHNMYEKRMKVIGEFVCDRTDYFGWISNPTRLDWKNYYDKNSCLTNSQLYDYSNGDCYYEWHISDLVIYDTPRGLTNFIVPSKIGCCNEGKCIGCKYFDRGNGFNVEDDCNAHFSTDEYKPLRRPPQSWCYVEEVNDEQAD